MRAAALLGAVLLGASLAGCGLPLPDGVRSAGAVPDATPRGGPVVVLPPGPAPGASPAEVVTGFLAAQASSADDYAVARQFLADDVPWDPGAGIEVYDAGDADRSVLVRPEEDGTVAVEAPRTAQVRADGSYRRLDGTISDRYGVACAAPAAPGSTRTCRISSLPAGYGLRLSSQDLQGSFAPQGVHYLAPSPGGAAPDSLVVDLVWLPAGDGLAGRLVRQLVEEGPSEALADSARTAVPPETQVLGVDAAADGTVTVDLSAPAGALDAVARERLSAQLVWTLRGLGDAFTGLRLLVQGAPLDLPGEPAVQPASAWSGWSPEPLGPRVASYYLVDGALRAVDGGLVRSAATDGSLAVRSAAVAPDGTLALVTASPASGEGTSALVTGPQAGPLGAPRLTGALSSPTWGDGQRGVWLVRDGALVRVPGRSEPVAVPVEGLARYGPVRAVRLSRDGVRVALLAGDRDAPRLVVGRLVAGEAGPQVTGLREIVPGLRDVADVAWETSTTLAVVSRFLPFGRLPARVAVDGSSVVPSGLRLPEGTELLSVAAAADRPLVVGAAVAGEPQVLREDGQVLAPVARGGSPTYPG